MKLLVVVDVQNDFVTGSLGTVEAQNALPRIRKYIGEAIKKGYRVVYTRDTHLDNYGTTFEGSHLPIGHCKFGSWGWQICDGVEKHGDQVIGIINKSTFGYDGWMAGELENFNAIEIVGFCTDICVIANAFIIKTIYPEIPITIIENCCAGTTPDMHEAALKVMRSCMMQIISI